jgi:C1A family cysteine protease
MKRLYNRVKSKFDARDIKYDAATPVEIPPVVDLSGKCTPVFDQGELGSCTGNAIVGALEYQENIQSETPVHLSRLFVYYNERLLEGDTDQDAGAEIRDGIKTLLLYGACDDALWPYDVSKFTEKPSLEAYTDGLKHKALQYQSVDQTQDALTHALASGHPVVIGITVYDSLESDEAAATGTVPMPDTQAEQCLGGHAVLLVGYDLEKRLWKVRNSWGPDWGDKGYFTLPFDYLLDPDLSDDFWAILKIS